MSGSVISPRSSAEPGSRKRAKPHAERKPSVTEASEESTATSSELTRAEVSRVSDSTAWYQRSDGPVNGGIGKEVACSENSTSTTTGRKMKP